MLRSSARRGQVEPLAAIAAVFALGVGLTVYAGALTDALPGGSEPSVQPTLGSAERAVSDGGVVDPGRLTAARAATPDGHRLNATLETDERRWHLGPTPPGTARNGTARVSVRTAPGRVRPGRLTVRIWR